MNDSRVGIIVYRNADGTPGSIVPIQDGIESLDDQALDRLADLFFARMGQEVF